MAREKMNIVGAIEFVEEYFDADKPDPSESRRMKSCLRFMTKELKVNEWQALFIVAVIHEAWDGYSSNSNIADFMKCSPLRMAQHKEDITDLLRRRMVRFSKQRDMYCVNKEFMEAVAQGKEYNPNEMRENLSFQEFWKSILSLIKAYLVDMANKEEFVDAVIRLCEMNKQQPFAEQFLKFCDAMSLTLQSDEITVFVLICNKLINRNSYLDVDALEELFDDHEYDFFCKCLKTKNLTLFTFDLIQFAYSDGEADTSQLMLSDSAAKLFFPGMSNYVEDKSQNTYLTKKADDIHAKELYYNEKESKDITQLADLLDEANYNGIHVRMVEANFRSGFTALFYGAPGTGKTETVYQIARKTGRDIFQVNFADMRSKWVGESEKNVRNLFLSYKNAVKTNAKTPILLFNEADAIIGSRMKSDSMHAVDKMENTVQNIILQEMEDLDGIMIATTNLTENIDKAFDRRFLYKVKFEKPTLESRVKIWKSMVKDIPDDIAEKLAKAFELSGGQIENVTRRSFINYLLYSTPQTDYEALAELCQNEREDSRGKKMGF
ncbi:MAG: ATP-binding protein [Bacteroidales bacterium]|nr:ATP-binding protein [Bacteroidales bacterium]